MEKMIEDLLNRGYVYDTFREGETFHPYESFEADVDFWYGKYCEDVDTGVNDPDEGIAEYIAGKIDEDHPTESPEQFNSLIRWVREVLPKVEKNWSVNIREAQISGTMQYANGEASGRALAGDLANKGIRDITPGPNGRGQAEVDKTGVYVGVPMGPDKTAWANPVAAKNTMSPAAAARVDKFQKAYAAAPAKEKAAMQDWSPEKPDMSMNKNAQVVDNNTGTVMPTAAQPQAKSSILQKLGFKESLFEDILKVSKLNESCSNSEDCDEAVENIKAEKKTAAAAKRAAREGITEEKAHLFECIINLQESSANMTANAIAKRLSSYDGTDNGAKELVDYISKVLGSAAVIGTEGLKNDLPGFYQNHKDVENMTLAAAAVRSKNTPNALKLYQRFAKQLNANVDPNAVAQAIQAAEKDQTLSLQQAQAQVQK